MILTISRIGRHVWWLVALKPQWKEWDEKWIRWRYWDIELIPQRDSRRSNILHFLMPTLDRIEVSSGGVGESVGVHLFVKGKGWIIHLCRYSIQYNASIHVDLRWHTAWFTWRLVKTIIGVEYVRWYCELQWRQTLIWMYELESSVC